VAAASAGPCVLLQTDNHASTPTTQFFTGRMPFLMSPNQQCQSTKGKLHGLIEIVKYKKNHKNKKYMQNISPPLDAAWQQPGRLI